MKYEDVTTQIKVMSMSNLLQSCGTFYYALETAFYISEPNETLLGSNTIATDSDVNQHLICLMSFTPKVSVYIY